MLLLFPSLIVSVMEDAIDVNWYKHTNNPPPFFSPKIHSCAFF